MRYLYVTFLILGLVPGCPDDEGTDNGSTDAAVRADTRRGAAQDTAATTDSGGDATDGAGEDDAAEDDTDDDVQADDVATDTSTDDVVQDTATDTAISGDATGDVSSDDAADDVGNADVGGTPHQYVLILDQSSVDAVDGADLVAIALTKQGTETMVFAEEVHEVEFAEVPDANELNQVLGAPGETPDTCDSEAIDYVSLGGEGGYAIVSFTGLAVIEEGDTITVWECEAEASEGDSYNVFIGAQTTRLPNNWVPCTIGAEGMSECIVPHLE